MQTHHQPPAAHLASALASQLGITSLAANAMHAGAVLDQLGEPPTMEPLQPQHRGFVVVDLGTLLTIAMLSRAHRNAVALSRSEHASDLPEPGVFAFFDPCICGPSDFDADAIASLRDGGRHSILARYDNPLGDPGHNPHQMFAEDGLGVTMMDDTGLANGGRRTSTHGLGATAMTDKTDLHAMFGVTRIDRHRPNGVIDPGGFHDDDHELQTLTVAGAMQLNATQPAARWLN